MQPGPRSSDALRLLINLVLRLMGRGRELTMDGPLPLTPDGQLPISAMTADEVNAALRRGEPVGERYRLGWAGSVSQKRKRTEWLLVAIFGVAVLALGRRTRRG